MAKNETVSRINKQAEQQLNQLLKSTSVVKIGILADPDKGKWKASNKKLQSDNQGVLSSNLGVTILDIGVFHEFGTEHIPQRSFLRSTFTDEKNKLGDVYFALMKRAIRKLDNAAPRWVGTDVFVGNENKALTTNIETVLKLMGAWFVGKVRKKFTRNDWPKLADPMRGGKQRNPDKGFIGPPRQATPLVDTGQLRASIAYQVEMDAGNFIGPVRGQVGTV